MQAMATLQKINDTFAYKTVVSSSKNLTMARAAGMRIAAVLLKPPIMGKKLTMRFKTLQ